MDWDDSRHPGSRLVVKSLVEEMDRQREMLTAAVASRPTLDEMMAGLRGLSPGVGLFSTIAAEVARARQPWIELSEGYRSIHQIGTVGEPSVLTAARICSSRALLEDQLGALRLLAADLEGVAWRDLVPISRLSTVGVEVLLETSESLFGSFVGLANAVAAQASEQVHPAVFDIPPLRVAAQQGLFEQPMGRAAAADDAEEASEHEHLRELLEAELAGRIEYELPARLDAVGPGLSRLWRGAAAAARSSNPDRVRHASVSLRELRDHVLRGLAPDAEIEAWNPDPELKHQGRFKRSARLAYVARNARPGPFEDFTKKSHEAALAACELFQKGTHSLEEPLDARDAEVVAGVAAAHLLWILRLGED